jgi:hypothetical protein
MQHGGRLAERVQHTTERRYRAAHLTL